jgi:hypothetical protein
VYGLPFVRQRLPAQTNFCDILHGFLRYLLWVLAYINRSRRRQCVKLHYSFLIVGSVAVICCYCCYHHHHHHQQQKRLQSRRRPSAPQCSHALTCCVHHGRFHSIPELLTLKTAKETTLVLRNYGGSAHVVIWGSVTRHLNSRCRHTYWAEYGVVVMCALEWVDLL